MLLWRYITRLLQLVYTAFVLAYERRSSLSAHGPHRRPVVTVDPHDAADPSAWVMRWADRVPAGGRVLDLACGSGRHARYFAGRGHPVEAVDLDAGKLDRLAGIPGVAV